MVARTATWVLLGVILLASTTFLVDVGPTTDDGARDVTAVPFEDTIVLTDLTDAEKRVVSERDLEVPRAEVFYSQYRYVVGHVGLSSLASTLGDDGQSRQFGEPLDVLVSDYSTADLALTDDGYLTTTDGYASWVRVEDAVFVVDSRARRPGGAVVVPFADRAAARAFTAEFGGDVLDWQAFRSRVGRSAARTVDAGLELAQDRSAWADGATVRARSLTARPVAVTVGEDAPTLAAAIDAAPPNTTIRVPPGTYSDVNVTVEKPVTIAGAGANATTLVGSGNGSVVRAVDARVAVTDLSIRGIGEGRGEQASAEGEGEWDARIMQSYAHADSGVVFEDAPGSYVADVRIDTPTNGVTVRYSDGVVVERVHVTGSSPWQAGFMSTLAAHSRIVVQQSTFHGGRDGVYLHVADGTVVRGNAFADVRFGVHEMYTSNALVARNAVGNASTGVVVMTRPEGNVVLGNAIRDSGGGVDVAGRSSYVLRNVVVGNERGLEIGSYRSLYAENVVYGNDVGLRGSTLVPTNVVIGNDVVANDAFASSSLGPVRVWTRDGRGNYWASAPGVDRDGDGVLDRAFHPTGPVDRSAARSPDVHVLANSPAVRLLRADASSMPGLRPSGVLDVAPLAVPVRPAVLASVRATADAPATTWVNATDTNASLALDGALHSGRDDALHSGRDDALHSERDDAVARDRDPPARSAFTASTPTTATTCTTPITARTCTTPTTAARRVRAVRTLRVITDVKAVTGRTSGVRAR